MKVKGKNVSTIVDNLVMLPEIAEMSTVEKAKAFLRMDQNEIYQGSPTDPLNPSFLLEGYAYALNDEFFESFPSRFALTQGRWPQNGSEIAITYSDAGYWGIKIGRMMNYTHTLNGEKRTVFVVGIFTQPGARAVEIVSTNAIAIVTEEVLNPDEKSTEVFISLDKSIISPLDGRGSLSRLHTLDNTIKGLDPDYTPETPYSDYVVEDYLAAGIRDYLDWLTSARLHQVWRSQSIILLTGMMLIVSIRFNINSRKSEQWTWFSRGASSRRIHAYLAAEIIVLSIIGFVIGLLFGVVVSRFGAISVRYLVFDWRALGSSGSMVTYDTITFLLLTAILTPLIVFLTNQRSIQEKEIEEKEHGRLAKMAKSLRLIQWDLALLAVALLFLAALYFGGNTVRNIPALMLIFSYLPIPLFISIASLLGKLLPFSSKVISRMYTRVFGHSTAYIGLRRLGFGIRSTGPIILVIGLVLSITLNSMIITESFPQTQANRARFLIGSDVSFHLRNTFQENWSDFCFWAEDHGEIEAFSIVSVGTLTLSEGSLGKVSFVAIKPNEYVDVGFTYTGLELEKSSLSSMLESMENNTEGAIITQDIADEYNLGRGDTVRAFTINEEEVTIELDIIGIVAALSEPSTVEGALSQHQLTLGLNKVWVNNRYLSSISDLNSTSENYLCIRMSPNCNGTILGQEFSETFGPAVLEGDAWSSVSNEVDALASQEEYQIDRSIDSMIGVITVIPVVLVLAIYSIQSNHYGKREIAILKSLGVEWKHILSTRALELFGLVLVALLVVVIFDPILVTNMIEVGMSDYSTWSVVFPEGPCAAISWSMIGFSLFVYAIFPLLLVILGSARDGEVSVSESLDANWSRFKIDMERWQ